MKELMISELFNLDETIAKDIFAGKTYPWEVLPQIGVLYFAVLLLISCIANGGFESGLGKNMISLAICMVGGIIGGIIS